MLHAGCDEALPPRESPPQLFTVESRSLYDYYSGKTPQSYRNQIKYTFVIKNIYDETIEDTLDFSGKLNINWFHPPGEEFPKTTKTIGIKFSDIKYIRGYNRSTGIFTFDPSDSIIIETNWNFLSDDSLNLLEYFPANWKGGFLGCKVTSKVTITASASFQLMKHRAGIIVKSFNYSHCFFAADSGQPPCSEFVSDPCE